MTQMERHTAFLGWKNQDCENEYTTQSQPIKLPMAPFTELEQMASQFVRKGKRLRIAKDILRKNNRVGEIRVPDFRLYYKAAVYQDSRVPIQK